MNSLIVEDINDAQTANLETPYSFRAFSAIKNYCINNVSDQDIIHAHLFPANFFCSIIKILGFTNAKLITTEHSTYNRRRGKFWGKIIDKIIYKSYDHIISISNGTKKKLIEWLPETKNRIIVIKNGCALKHKKPIIREKNKSTIKLVSVGALKTAKNYELTIKSIIHIKDLDFKWTIAGDGALRNKLNKEIEKLGLIDKIKFIGRVDPIWTLLEQSDIFIITSIWEGFGMAAVEAMNSTLPIVASDIPGLKEIVGFEESKCALFVNPLDDYDISIIKDIITLRPSHAFAQIRALFWIIFHPNIILSKRTYIKKIRNVTDSKMLNDIIFNKSIVYQYFVKNIKQYSNL